MFSKNEAKSSKTSGPVTAATTNGGRKMMPSILAPDIRINGDIKGEGELHIEGPLDGNVDAEAVYIGPEGHVNGSVKADRVVVSGTVEGDIKARDVSFEESAQVKGSVTVTEAFEVIRGARFSGKTAFVEKTGKDKVTGIADFASERKTNGAQTNGKSNGKSNGGMPPAKADGIEEAPRAAAS